jgi:hypothetical protein
MAPFFLVLGSGEGATGEVMIGRGVMSQVRTSSGTSLFKRQVCCCALPVLHLANSNTNGAPSSGIAKRRSWTNFNKKHVFYLFIYLLFSEQCVYYDQ